jgi:hypothetical protein
MMWHGLNCAVQGLRSATAALRSNCREKRAAEWHCNFQVDQTCTFCRHCLYGDGRTRRARSRRYRAAEYILLAFKKRSGPLEPG